MKLAIENVVSKNKLKEVRNKLDAAYKSGKFIDGKSTARGAAKLAKKNQQLKADSKEFTELGKTITNCLNDSDIFKVACYPKIVKSPLFSYYKVGMEYDLHVDSAVMGIIQPIRTDLSVTVFLNDPDEYEGGELEIHESLGTDSIKLNAGDAIIYPSTALHRVAPVTKGVRKVAVTWAQSKVRDEQKRQLLYDSFIIQKALDRLAKTSHEASLARKTYQNLLRLWVDI